MLKDFIFNTIMFKNSIMKESANVEGLDRLPPPIERNAEQVAKKLGIDFNGIQDWTFAYTLLDNSKLLKTAFINYDDLKQRVQRAEEDMTQVKVGDKVFMIQMIWSDPSTHSTITGGKIKSDGNIDPKNVVDKVIDLRNELKKGKFQLKAIKAALKGTGY